MEFRRGHWIPLELELPVVVPTCVLGPNSGPLEEQYILLTMEIFFHSPFHLLAEFKIFRNLKVLCDREMAQ